MDTIDTARDVELLQQEVIETYRQEYEKFVVEKTKKDFYSLTQSQQDKYVTDYYLDQEEIGFFDWFELTFYEPGEFDFIIWAKAHKEAYLEASPRFSRNSHVGYIFKSAPS